MNTNSPTTCPVCLCKHSETSALVHAASPGFTVDCPTCGKFHINKQAWDDFLNPSLGSNKKLSSVSRARLSHRIRIATATDGYDRPKIELDYVKAFVDNGCPGPNPAQQATNLVPHFGNLVSKDGTKIDLNPNDFFSIIGSPTPEFASDIAQQLIERSVLIGRMEDLGEGPAHCIDASLSLSGWELYEQTKRGLFRGNYGFIAMKFGDEQLDPFVSDHVKPPLKEALGYDLVDLRDVARAGVIDNIMRAQIRDSAFVLVDLTHDNSGAYWEAGYAEGLGKPVIYLCEVSKFEKAKTHFDTNHCTTVIWNLDEVDKFKAELIATLRRSLNLFS